jgi:DNA-binding MarR family transcriptional regulator
VTPAGRATFRRAQPLFVEAVSGVLQSRLTKSEIRELHTLLAKLASPRRP